VIVNEHTARTFWPKGDVIGKQVRFGGDRSKNPPVTVVGVVNDVRHQALTSEPKYEVYRPWRQSTAGDVYLVVRTAGDPESVVPELRSRLREIDPEIPLFNVRTMQSYVTDARSDQRLAMLLFGIFAAIALLLAAVGIYGVTAYAVEQRTSEIGIRMALGAARQDVLRMVVGQGLRLVLGGLAFGLVGSWALTRVLGEMLYGVSPTDPVVFGGVVVVLLAVAIAANWIPARRASQVDPMVALRYE